MAVKEQVQLDILKETEGKALSIEHLSENINFPYYTVRRAVASLVDKGLLKHHSTVDRHRLYISTGVNPEQLDFIPLLTDHLNRKTLKPIDLIGVDVNKLQSLVACREFPQLIANLFLQASYADHGQDVNKSLTELRHHMQINYLRVKNICNFYEQMLDEPRYWESKSLGKMTEDTDYNYTAIQNGAQAHENLS